MRRNGNDPLANEASLIDAAQQDAMAFKDAPPVRLPSTDAFPGYELLTEIHRGGQGIVYEALQRSTGRRVAVKVVHPGPFAGAHDRARFEREVQILSQLRHPGIVAIHDSGVAHGCVYYVMDLIAGESLDAYVAARGLTLKQILALFASVSEAVNVAHLRGVIHRDLKPGNVHVDPSGQPHILDFGLAKISEYDAMAAASPTTMTQTGQFIGSLPWASPEQAEGRHELIDVRTDVYALGVMLYHVVTWRFPYDVSGPLPQTIDRIVNATPIPPSSVSRGIGDEVQTIILKCLSKDRERRYQSAGELARDLRHYLNGEPIQAKRDSTWYVLRKSLQRHRAAAAVATAFVLLIGGSAAGLGIMYARQGDLLDEAQVERDNAQLVRGFLQDTLESVTPEIALGRDVTILREVLDHSSALVSDRLTLHPEAEADVRRTIGTTYRSLGLFDAALPHLERALELRRSLYGQQHGQVAVSLSDLASLFKDLGQYQRARPLYEEALEIYSAVKGEDHQFTATLLASLANLHYYQGDAQASLQLHQQALERLRAVERVNPTVLAEELSSYGAVLVMLARYGEAEPLLRESLELKEKQLGPEHPKVAATLHNLASALLARGDTRGAEEMYIKTLEMRRRLLSRDHPDTVQTMNSLGHLHYSRGNYAAAEPLFREAIEIRRARLGPMHPDLAQSLLNLSMVLQARNQLAEAEPPVREALQIERAQPSQRSLLADIVSGLGVLLYFKGDYAGAEPLFRESLDLRRRLLGDHPDTAMALSQLGGLYRKLRRYEEAEPLFREALRIQRAALAREDPVLAGSLSGLGSLLTDLGRPDEAEPLLREALAIRRAKLPPNHWLTMTTASALGACLTAIRHFEEAETLLIEATSALSSDRGPAHERTVEAMRHLVNLYEQTGRPDEAERCRLQLAQTGQ